MIFENSFISKKLGHDNKLNNLIKLFIYISLIIQLNKFDY